MVVQHNLRAMNANRLLGINTSVQAKSTEKLSSGYKINRAADDAAGLSISEKMRKQIRGLTQASLNAQDGISAVQTAEGALNEVQDMLQRMNELAVKAANGTMSENDRSYIQNEISQLEIEIDRVAGTTKFNETYLLKGDKGADKLTTFSYAEGTSVTFADGVDVLYGADGTEFKNAEALEEYLRKNPDAKVYTSPASATVTGGGVTEVTIKSNVNLSSAPQTDTTYKYGSDGSTTGWFKQTTPAGGSIATAAENTLGEGDWVAADDEVKKLFDLKGTPQAGTTIQYKAPQLAEAGKDYKLESIRGNTGNSAITDGNKTELTTVECKAFENLDEFKQALADKKDIYKVDKDGNWTGATVGKDYNYYAEDTITGANGIDLTPDEEGKVAFYAKGEEDAGEQYTKDTLLAALKENPSAEIVDKDNNAVKVYVEGGENAEGVTRDNADIVFAAAGTLVLNDGLKATDFGVEVEKVEDKEDEGDTNPEYTKIESEDDLKTKLGDSENYDVYYKDGDEYKAVTDSQVKLENSELVYGTKGSDEDYVFGDFEFYSVKKEQSTPSMANDMPAYPGDGAQPVSDPEVGMVDDAAYYDADGNKIAANALTNYIEYDSNNNAVKFKADARPIYDKDGNAITNDNLKDDIVVNKDALVGALELKLHVGADATANNQISIKLSAMDANGLGIKGIKVDGATDENALSAIDTIKEAIQKVSTQRSALGAVQNRLEHTIANLDNVVENTTAAESQIRDTDMATEMVKYANNNILAQAGQAMLAQANQGNQGVLSLLG